MTLCGEANWAYVCDVLFVCMFSSLYLTIFPVVLHMEYFKVCRSNMGLHVHSRPLSAGDKGINIRYRNYITCAGIKEL